MDQNGQTLPDFEYAVCVNCGTAEFTVRAQLKDWLSGNPGSFTLVACTQCGLLRQNPRPTPSSIHMYYADDYKPFADTQGSDGSQSRLAKWSIDYGMRRRVAIISRHMPAGRLLEVGCATGLFLNSARDTGKWDVMGLEPSLSAAQVARQRYGLNVIEGTYEDVEFESEAFDIVVMWDVLEHLHEPVKAVEDVARILKPGGLFVMKVPHLHSFARRVWGRYWAGFDAPRHLYVFSEPLLVSVLQRAGFSVLEKECWGGYHIAALSLLFWLRDRAIDSGWFGFVQKADRVLKALPIRALTLPWFTFVDRILRRGSALILVARKEMGE